MLVEVKRPRSFSCKRFPKRSNKGAPKPSSKSAKAILAALCVSLTASLALVTVPSWATATKQPTGVMSSACLKALTFKSIHYFGCHANMSALFHATLKSCQLKNLA